MKQIHTLCLVLILFALTLLGISVQQLENVGAREPGAAEESSVFLPYVVNQQPPIIPDSTEVLSDATTQHLTAVSADLSEFTFSEMTSEIARLDVGDVMVSGPTSAAPYGFLRTVSSLDSSGSEVIVGTEPAALEDAVEQGSFRLNRTFTPSDVVTADVIEGASVRAVTSPHGEEGWYIELDGSDLGCVEASGSVSLSNLHIDGGGDVSDFSLRWFRAVVTADVTDDLTFEVVCNQDIVDVEGAVASFLLDTTVVPVGPVPVVFFTTLDVVVGAEGEVSLGASLEGTVNVHFSAGAVYEDGNFSPVGEFNGTFDGPGTQPVAGIDAKGYAGAEVQLLLYGVTGVYVRNAGFLEMETDVFDERFWTLYGGFEAPVGLELNILFREVDEYEVLALRHREVVAQGSDDPPPTSTPTSVPTSTPTATPTATVEPECRDEPFVTCLFGLSKNGDASTYVITSTGVSDTTVVQSYYGYDDELDYVSNDVVPAGESRYYSMADMPLPDGWYGYLVIDHDGPIVAQ